MKKLVIAVTVACGLSAFAAPPHQKPGLVHQYHEASAFGMAQHESASASRGDRRASADRARAGEAPKGTERPYEGR